MEEIEENPRLKLLSLRSQVVPEFRDIRNIPLREREIPQDIFQVRSNLLLLHQFIVALVKWNVSFPHGPQKYIYVLLKKQVIFITIY